MARKQHKPEEIIRHLRTAEIERGSSIAVGPNPVWVGKLSDDGNLLHSLASGKWGTRDGFAAETFILKH